MPDNSLIADEITAAEGWITAFTRADWPLADPVPDPLKEAIR